MNSQIIVQIAELKAQTASVYLVALIGLIASALAATIAAGTAIWQVCFRQNHEKQWYFFNKNVALIETAVDLCWRLIYNKYILATYSEDASAKQRLFEILKDVDYCESLIMLYGDVLLARKLNAMKMAIMNTPDSTFPQNYQKLYRMGQDYLYEARKYIKKGLNEDLNSYKKSLDELPPGETPKKEDTPKIASTTTMGTIRIVERP